ncbi:MAG: indolepyruvate ferredoxin oxidoreductase subunit alpha [Treponema sp.]|nr:indolepyruvate ferredoxin oxidoreductase subunit alpha [Treponema sp.]
MNKEIVMGNQAIALGALKAGVNLVSGYPGTPSSEIIEYIAKYRKQTGTYVEWSVNEKAAVEVAAGASYSGARTLVTMKQVGLNVAGDPVMCLAYVGVKGGMVIVSADDPGPISSQTEQDTRRYGEFSKLPVFDPSSPEEAYEMIQQAFEYSEKYSTPVLFRPTTRVDHGYASIQVGDLPRAREVSGFEKDSQRWVIFPRTSYLNHKKIFDRNLNVLPEDFSTCGLNFVHNEKKDNNLGIVTGGISYAYVREVLDLLGLDDVPVLKIGTPYPFPDRIAGEFLQSKSHVLVVEELDPVIEDALLRLKARENLTCSIHGKYDGKTAEAGEYSIELVKKFMASFLSLELKEEEGVAKPELPVRPPVLCAGCPHRASFYAVKQAMKGQETVYCGDIGCYTLGNAKPLDMTDTCLCMGADITMAQGFFHVENDRHCFSFIGDSTFFASGITGVVNAVYNKARQTLCILDNSTTAMTGHQPHPGTGVTMMGDITDVISIEQVLKAIGVEPVITVNPFDQKAAVEAVKVADDNPGVSAVIFKAPCIALLSKDEYKAFRKNPSSVKNDKCIGCRKCVNETGCPALCFDFDRKKAVIDPSLCTGCTLCSQVCPVEAIKN